MVYIGCQAAEELRRFRFAYLNSILHIHFIHGQFGKRKTFISFQSANLHTIYARLLLIS